MNSNRLLNKVSREKNMSRSTDKSKSFVHKKSNDLHDDESIANDVIKSDAQQQVEDDQIINLCIDENKLLSRRVPQPPSQKQTATVKVRKAIFPSIPKTSKETKKVMVAHPVQESQVKEISQVLPASSIPNFTKQDALKEHLILGTLQEFCEEAVKRGYPMSVDESTESLISEEYVHEDDPEDLSSKRKFTMDEKSALNNWQKKMLQRKRQQNRLAQSLLVPVKRLLMNQSDIYRSIQEQRSLIDQAMPFKDYGKGYRVGSEFWKQVEAIGCDEGISITLKETEKGNVSQIEHIGYSKHIKTEMGQSEIQSCGFKNGHHPWMKSSYLRERKQHLKDVMDELDSHQPYFDELEVIGQSLHVESSVSTEPTGKRTTISCVQDLTEKELTHAEENEDSWSEENGDLIGNPLKDYEDVIPEPIFGPSLIINGHTACWQGPENPDNDDVGVLVRLLFEAEVECCFKNNINITNDGTTAIHYYWKRISQNDVFGLGPTRPINRFYFDVDDGVILPGATINIPVFFKSPNAGIFMETWQLGTKPTLFAGGAIQCVLRGFATKVDDQKNQREILDKQLHNRQTMVMAQRIIKDLLSGIQTPVRPSTPNDIYVTEEDIFLVKNKKIVYKNNIVNNLKDVYADVKPEGQWDLSVDTLLKEMLSQQDEDAKESNLKKLNVDISNLSTTNQLPLIKSNFETCYQIMCETIDNLSAKALKLQVNYEVPERPFLVKVDSKKLKSKINENSNQKHHQRTDSKGQKKDSPIGRNKTPFKEKNKVEPLAAVSSEAKVVVPTVDFSDPNYLKYLEKLYIQVYSCLLEMVDGFDAVLSTS